MYHQITILGAMLLGFLFGVGLWSALGVMYIIKTVIERTVL